MLAAFSRPRAIFHVLGICPRCLFCLDRPPPIPSPFPPSGSLFSSGLILCGTAHSHSCVRGYIPPAEKSLPTTHTGAIPFWKLFLAITPARRCSLNSTSSMKTLLKLGSLGDHLCDSTRPQLTALPICPMSSSWTLRAMT